MDKGKLLRQAQDGLVIQTVDLRSAEIKSAPSFSSQTASQFSELLVQSKKDFLGLKYYEDENGAAGYVSLEYSLGTRLVTSVSEEQQEQLLEIEACFSANYLINPENSPNEDAIKIFAEENALFHVWPYWREFVQSTCSRVGVPAIPVEMRPGLVKVDNLVEQEQIDLPKKK